MLSANLSLAVATTSERAKVATCFLSIEHETVSPFTVIAISCVTGWPTPTALFTAGSASEARPNVSAVRLNPKIPGTCRSPAQLSYCQADGTIADNR